MVNVYFKISCIGFLFFFLTVKGYSQTDSLAVDSVSSPKVVQFSGVLVEADSLFPVPYSNVYRQRDNMGVVSNNLGFFTLPAFEGDTIVFSNIGFRNQYYAIPEGVEDGMLSIVQVLTADTILLSETKIYPWPADKAALRKELLALELPSNVLARSQNNLDPLDMETRLSLLPGDSNTAYAYAMNQEVLKLQTMGTARNVSLLDPFAWAQFLSALRNGSLRRP